MKILWILPGNEHSKTNMVFAKRTRNGLENLGAEIKVYHLISRLNPLVLFKSWLEIRKIIKDFQPDVVHAHYGSVTGLFSTLLKVPTVITFRGSDVNSDPATSSVRRLFTKIMSAAAAGLSRHNIFVSDFLRRNIFFAGQSYSILPSPLNLNLFIPIEKSDAREKLNLRNEKKYLAFITSGDRSVKRPELAELVCKILIQRGYDAEILKIHNVDPEEVPTWINASDCLIFTSIREGSPNAVREALACGVPVVSVNVGDVSYWVNKDPKSKIIYSDSPELLAGAVLEAWDAPRKRRADLSEVDLENHINKIFKIYKSLSKNSM